MKQLHGREAVGQHLYIHVPFCDGKCAYCAFYSERYAWERANRYLDALDTEASIRFNETEAAPETIYVGGGTPSILNAAQLAPVRRIVTERPALRDRREWTVEANPGTLSPEKLRVLRDAGVNRISLGVQSFDDALLHRIGRRPSAAAVGETVPAIRNAGIANIGLDLIAALPGADDANWLATLQKAVEIGPQHISAYALTVEQGSRLAALAETGRLISPTADAQLRALDQAEQALTAAGYVRYEISNYAKPGFEAKHNLSCWRGEDYLGLGPAASSRVGLKRWTNQPSIEQYVEALAAGHLPPRDEETVSPDTDAAERLVFAFRLAEGVDLETYAAIPGSRPDQWMKTLERLATDGLTEARHGRWHLTPRGCDLADFVAAELL